MNLLHLVSIGVGAFLFVTVFLAIFFRVVVSTNDVHIVQSAKKTVSYGKDQQAGNVYYQWPSWVPRFGVKTIQLPVSVFDQTLDGYAAYDKGRVPFIIDIIAFFRITNSNTAAQRVHSFPELLEQLKSILQGAIRSILASSEIEEILEGRSKFGEMFTKEVDHQLIEWGVQNVKSIELMDIRDAEGSHVIANIMAKKKSLIEMQSRIEVANNIKSAQMAEVDAKREVEVRQQDAVQQVGIRTAQQVKEVGVANEKAKQDVKEEAKITAEKDMAVLQVQHVRQAEIQKQVQIVEAEQVKATTVIHAEGQKQQAIVQAEGTKQQTVIVAEGNLEQAKLHAEGVRVEGEAKGAADTAVLMAPVTTQVTLAKEIGQNPGYQTYLVSIRQIEANQVVGIEQAKALTAAEIKVIANSGNVVDGVDSVMGLLTPKGGTQIGAMLEAFKNTDVGKAVVKAVTNGGAEKHQ